MIEVNILHTNDIHSEFNQFCKIAHTIEQIKTSNSILLDAGDFNDYSSPLTRYSDGLLGLKLLYSVGYEALSVGNNEGFQKISDQLKISHNEFVDILSCNLFSSENHRNIYKQYKIIERNGINFLIIGVSPFQASYNEYYRLFGVYATEPYSITKKIIQENKDKFDVIILLSHLGLKSDIMFTQVIENHMIIIGGHSHHNTKLIKANNAYIHHSGVRGSHLGILNMNFDDEKHLLSINAQNISTKEMTEYDDAICELFLLEEQKVSEKLIQNFCKISRNLNSSMHEECNFTNLIVDCLYDKYKCDFALINSGITAKTLHRGKITYKDLSDVCKSPLRIATMKIKGEYILKALNDSLNNKVCLDMQRRPGYREKYLGKLHVSHNCKIVYSGRNIELYINGIKADADSYYYVVTNDYLSRGMGYYNLGKNEFYSLDEKNTLLDMISYSLKNETNYSKIDQFRWDKK